MTLLNLSQLKPVDIREVWKNEARDFTPWLAQEENLNLLGEALGIELQLESQEQNVGPYSADIYCRDTETDDWVVIENQLDTTDHSHLGQILTYAAGLDALKLIWIARKFTDEHRAALEWLNEATQENISFFGVEIQLWRIGESPIAPQFNIVCQPNNWTKQCRKRASGELSDFRQLQQEFWFGFDNFMNEKKVAWMHGPPKADHVMGFPTGRTGIKYYCYFSKWSQTNSTMCGEIAITMVLSRHDADLRFQALMANREQVEKAIGDKLIWMNRDDVKRRKIIYAKQIDYENTKNWPQYWEWLLDSLKKMKAAFDPLIQKF